MAHTEITEAGWEGTVERLGGRVRLEAEARATKAFERPRKIECAVDLLRLALAYCLGVLGLRLTAAWAEGIGLASLSNVALLGRLRNCVLSTQLAKFGGVVARFERECALCRTRR